MTASDNQAQRKAFEAWWSGTCPERDCECAGHGYMGTPIKWIATGTGGVEPEETYAAVAWAAWKAATPPDAPACSLVGCRITWPHTHDTNTQESRA